MKNKITEEKVVFENTLKIMEATIENEGKTFRKYKINRENAAAVLVYNRDKEKYILTRQFRYPIASETKEYVLEIVAGKIENDNDALTTAIKETKEEIGYKITKENTRLLLTCFASPGYSSEQLFIYYSVVGNADKITEGGGLEEENEHIEIVEIPKKEFEEMIKNKTIMDAKTYLAGLAILLENGGNSPN